MKLSTRPHRGITRLRTLAAFAAAGCAAAVLTTTGPAAAGTAAARTGATAATATAAVANGRIAFSQWDLLPGGNLSGHSNVYTMNPNGTGRRQLTHVGKKQAAGAPDYSSDGTKIVYVSNQTGDYRIWVMNADGSGQKRLTNDPGFMDLQPAWSPDGRHIVFSRCTEQPGGTGCDLEVMNAKGTGVHRLAAGHWTWVHAEYSPDGRQIAVAADRGGFLSALWVMRSNGTGLHQITKPSFEAFWPEWSPDGRNILFTDNCCQGGSNIWTVRPNGTGLRKLTHFTMPLQDGFASYSPDGRQIVMQFNGKCPARGICKYLYVMNADGSGLHPVRTGVPFTFLSDWGRQPARTVATGARTTAMVTTGPPADGRIAFSDFTTGQIYTVNPDGTGLVQLTHEPSGIVARWPSWSPDGSRILFVPWKPSNGAGHIWIMRADGTGQHLLTSDAPGYRDYQPNYTPDGKRIVFTRCSPNDGLCAIWIMRADGTHRHLLVPFLTTPTETNNFDPNVSPDGRHISFTRFGFRGISSQVWVADISGKHAHPLTAPRLEAVQAAWSPDGGHIAFADNSSRAQSSVWVMRANGTGLRELAASKWPHNNFGPVYAPSGGQIAFSSDRRHPDFCCLDLFVMRANGARQHLIPTRQKGGVIDIAWGPAPGSRNIVTRS